MRIRPYEPGDEEPQARIFNTAAGTLPAFKPATAQEIARRYQTIDPDRSSRLYAVDEANGQVVGYAVFSPHGRISFPWCLPGFEHARKPLLDAVLAATADRGIGTAWAAYRADWLGVLAFFQEQGFAPSRTMINFVAETAALPVDAVPADLTLEALIRDDLPRLMELGRGLFAEDDSASLGEFLWNNPFFGPESLFALRARAGGEAVVGVGLAIASASFADPVKLDAAMPCFRLGALGTERERHKRVSGMVSCVFTDETVGKALVAEAARRLKAAGLAHTASQASSNRYDLIAFYDQLFQRQGSFPILSRPV